MPKVTHNKTNLSKVAHIKKILPREAQGSLVYLLLTFTKTVIYNINTIIRNNSNVYKMFS